MQLGSLHVESIQKNANGIRSVTDNSSNDVLIKLEEALTFKFDISSLQFKLMIMNLEAKIEGNYTEVSIHCLFQ